MIKELWSAFPRLIEQKINGLLDEAEPSPMKAFQLYRTCKRENLWTESFEKFTVILDQYFSLSKLDRRKGILDTHLNHPMDRSTYEDFNLTFRNARVNETELVNIASWAHHLMRVSFKRESLVTSTDILTRTLRYITNPPLFEKAKDITFDDFCEAWQRVVYKIFGHQHDQELREILDELRWLDTQLKIQEKESKDQKFIPTIYLTQTEIDWVEAVQRTTAQDMAIPKFPLSRGADKQRLMDLERTISLYRIVQTTRLPELMEQRNNIKITLLDQCARLLRDRAR